MEEHHLPKCLNENFNCIGLINHYLKNSINSTANDYDNDSKLNIRKNNLSYNSAINNTIKLSRKNSNQV